MINKAKLAVSKLINRWTILFTVFTIYCGAVCQMRGAGRAFFDFIPWVYAGCIIYIALAVWLRGNYRLLLITFCLMLIGSMVHILLDVSYTHDKLYVNQRTDIWVTLFVMLVVFMIYPKVYDKLSNDKMVGLMAAAIVLIYVLLLFAGSTKNGATAWIGPIQVTELIKFLFVFVIAGLLSKNQSKTRIRLSIVFMAMNIVCMGFICSEYGTLMIMVFVYLVFLFAFPERLTWIGTIAITVCLGIVIVLGGGNYLYHSALMNADPEVFAAGLTFAVDDAARKDNEFEAEKEFMNLLTSSVPQIDEKDDEETREIKQEKTVEINDIIKQIEDGQLTLEKFKEARALNENLSSVLTRYEGRKSADEEREEKDNVIQELSELDVAYYPAARAIALLAEDQDFRINYISKFCYTTLYGNTAAIMYKAGGKGLIRKAVAVAFEGYTKLMDRVVLKFMPEKTGLSLFGIRKMDGGITQVEIAQKAILLGGLWGAGIHEMPSNEGFFAMDSDMVFSVLCAFFGAITGLLVILLFMALFREGMRIQKQMDEVGNLYHRGVALGFSLTLMIQAMLIIGGNIGFFPLTGITLPFIASGTQSMMISGAMVMILFVISFADIRESADDWNQNLSVLRDKFGDRIVDKLETILWFLQDSAGRFNTFRRQDLFKDIFDDTDDGGIEEDEEDQIDGHGDNVFDEQDDLFDDVDDSGNDKDDVSFTDSGSQKKDSEEDKDKKTEGKQIKRQRKKNGNKGRSDTIVRKSGE